MNAANVDIILTNCYRPAWTRRAVEALRGFYPDNRVIVVNDRCVECEDELIDLARASRVHLVQMPERTGAGRALDAGLRAATSRWVLTHDHGVVMTRAGVIEHLLAQAGPGVAAVGKRLHNTRGEQYLGPAVYCDLALWDRAFIVEHDLSFKLVTLRFVDGSTFWGCTTGRYLCWNLRRLGKELRFVELDDYHTHEHARDSLGKKYPSPHEEVDFEDSRL